MSVDLHHLTSDDLPLMEALMTTFGEVFDEVDTFTAHRPSEGYLRPLMADDTFIALAAVKGGEVVGGVTAYELKKYEQERSEIYIFDLGVAEGHRREGIATALMEELKEIAAGRGAHLVFVQTGTRVEDEPAVALYTRFGEREDVVHFDIAVEGAARSSGTATRDPGETSHE